MPVKRPRALSGEPVQVPEEMACDTVMYRATCPVCSQCAMSWVQTILHLCEGELSGPGTELKALLGKIGIVAKPNCSCNKRARVMDEKGCDWCEEHIDEIDGWLAEEAKKRRLPYLSLAGKTLIRLAIRRARKKGNSR
jgi:hypothetical protein